MIPEEHDKIKSEPNQESQDFSNKVRSKMGFIKWCYLIMIISCLIGVAIINSALNHSDTIFQQIAGMVEGLCFAIIPYCICKGLSVLVRQDNEKTIKEKELEALMLNYYRNKNDKKITGKTDIIAQLNSLNDLKEKGAISEIEFQDLMKKLLNNN